METPDLNQKVVVVAGAAGRLGRRLAYAFAERGATVVALVSNEHEARNLPFPKSGEGWAYATDLTSESLMRQTFQQIAKQFTGIYAYVHASSTSEERPILRTELRDFEQILRVNLSSAFLGFREAARLMRSGEGRLVAIASRQGAERAEKKQAAFSAAHAGLLRLVEAASEEFRDKDVTATAIATGAVKYSDQDKQGVEADHLVDLCKFILTPAGHALNGVTLKTYG
jgi:3-oxoacyl-[acyl-carrier protein] reductase